MCSAEQKSDNIRKEESRVDRSAREGKFGQKAVTIWLTGLSCSGKSTIARALEHRLFEMGSRVYWLDGDNVRFGLSSDLGFSPEDRAENIRRIAEVSQLFNDAGCIVISSFISPYRADRIKARKIVGDDRFFEIYVATPIEVCEERDAKGLYKKARAGEITGFTGVDDPYEPPASPALTINTRGRQVSDCVDDIMHLLDEQGIFA
jgi:adenylyl-sulfate kinase